ncbi:unnamed protein product [Clavelina lepadiformis]|uniref:Uncharacterized protein n=1 Tax=Clavelina lepadiformis TaxID=159417 RepID=A0ABP0EWR8_CLALP
MLDQSLNIDLPQNDTREQLAIKKFNISSMLAKPFQGLTMAVESNLHIACRTGNCTWMKNILDGCSVFYPPIGTHHDVIRTKQTKPIKELINERNRLGASPLWLAAVMGHEEAVKLLVDYGADLETEDIKGQTPLYAATKFNHVKCVRLLLEAGANPDGSGTNISTPIYVTARDNYPEVMALLIRHGADVNGRHGRSHSSEMKRADYNGNLPVYMTLGNFENVVVGNFR